MLGSEIRFRLDLGPGSPPEVLPDAFSLFLLDPSSSTSLVDTDLLGDALLIVDLTGDGIVSVSGTSTPNVPNVVVGVMAVPEPTPLFLLATSLLLLLAMRRRRGGLLAWIALIALAPQLASAQSEVPVDDRVHVSLSGLVLNRATLTFDTTATLRNVGPSVLTNPLRLVISGVSDARVSLANATGTTALGQPFVELPASTGGLAPNAQARVILRFSNPSRVRFTFQRSVNAVCGVVGKCPLPRPARPFVLPPDWVVTRDTDYIVEAHNFEGTAFIRLYFQHFRTEGAGPPTARDYVTYFRNYDLGNVFPLSARGLQTAETEIGQAKFGGPYLRYVFDDTVRGFRYVQVYASGGGIPSIVLTGWARSVDFPAVGPALEAMIESVELPETP